MVCTYVLWLVYSEVYNNMCMSICAFFIDKPLSSVPVCWLIYSSPWQDAADFINTHTHTHHYNCLSMALETAEVRIPNLNNTASFPLSLSHFILKVWHYYFFRVCCQCFGWGLYVCSNQNANNREKHQNTWFMIYDVKSA